MRRILTLAGIQGAVKSTWAQRYVRLHPQQNVIWLNSDTIRVHLFGKGVYQSNDPAFIRQAVQTSVAHFKWLYQQCLLLPQVDVILVDAINLRIDQRRDYYRWAKAADPANVVIGVQFANDWRRAAEQVQQRPPSVGMHVPAEVIRNSARRFQPFQLGYDCDAIEQIVPW
ncbi:hypothetical protein IV38_GL001170 [Lactobacillus selangorensis]|uniref:Kinase n=1 Tax=Lactobacillus selangorensis TaxID=81857 RepID=A0A0R2FWR6_9LACO|nr:AAA family ATPase [Lactobacillus selangorensis]KRN28958.1 hypothetical protein IV38_GL001170 [Lactobacillus selangorensis]KRN32632.1 hypothetical protein IV40_GL000683 [Lactobacillus selangorensis]